MRFGWGKHKALLALSGLLLVAAGLRWYGLEWDQGYLFHPDERQLLMVASNLAWPDSLFQALLPSSPLNPHFFAYGSFPIYLLRALSVLAPPLDVRGPWANEFLASWAVFARAVSGLFDLGTITLTFLIGRRLYGSATGLLAAACLSLTVLSIQLAHFYTVDTLLTFLVMATLYAGVRMALADPGRARLWRVAAGILFGLALATKVSALPLVVPLVAAAWHAAGASLPPGSVRTKARFALSVLARPVLEMVGAAAAVFVVAQPYAVIDFVQFASAVGREAMVARGWLDYPYTRQYANTIPIIYQIGQSAIWGMGVPLGVFVWAGALAFTFRTGKDRDWRDVFLLSWGGVYFLSVALLYVKYPRYLLPLIPVLYLMAARALVLRDTGIFPKGTYLPRFARNDNEPPAGESRLIAEAGSSGRARTLAGLKVAAVAFVLGSSLLYSLAFVSIYSREHPWLSISAWIYENVKPGATLAVEAWDDPLPVKRTVSGVERTAGEYRTLVLPVQEADSAAKGQALARDLAQAYVVIVASQRGYGSVGRLDQQFPLMSRYYRGLFDGSLGFILVATEKNQPELLGWTIADDPRWGLDLALPSDQEGASGRAWNWGFADESLTVYDHPQALVFVKQKRYTADQLESILMSGDGN